MRTIPPERLYANLPLFTWAEGHHRQPAIMLHAWSIDRNLRVLKVEVRS